MKRMQVFVVFALAVILLAAGSTPVEARRSSSSVSRSGKTSSWSSSSRPSGGSGWGTPASKPSSSSSGSGWGSSSKPAATPSSGWGSSSKPAATPSSGWGSSSKPAATPSSGWGSSSSGTTTPKSDWGSAPSSATSRPASGSWGNSGGVSTTNRTTASGGSSFSSAGRQTIQKESSLKAYNAYRGRFAKPDNPVADSSLGRPPVPPSRTWDNYRDYERNRDTYYAGRGWSAPGYAYRGSPSFGLWDAMFLWFMLRQASGPTFMYNHQNDPGVKAFRQEADKQAASDPALRKQLDDVDAKMDQMRRDGVPVDPKAMPSGVDPSVALAAEQVVKEKPAAKGVSSWIWIAVAGFAVAAGFLFLSGSWKTASRR